MKLIERLMEEKRDPSAVLFWQLIGPIFVLCTFALMPQNILLFFVGAFGLLLCARLHTKGFFLSTLLLSISFVLCLTVFKMDLFWVLGIEASFALSFFITAQNADRQHFFLDSIFKEVDTKVLAISNLEEEINKTKLQTGEKQLLLQDKIGLMQKQLDEMASEQSSLTILNEVLRKTTARHIEEGEKIKESLLNERVHLDFLIEEKKELVLRLKRVQDESSLVKENKRLIDQINQMRLDIEQTHAMNETLERLHAKESTRAKDAIEQFELYKKESTSEEVSYLKSECERLEKERSQVVFQKGLSDKELDTLNQEMIGLKNSLREAQNAQIPQEDSGLIISLQNKVRDLSSVNAKYKQLKEQFEKKNEVLHETRGELFKLDTALQSLQREVAFEDKIDPRDIGSMFSRFEEEIKNLHFENKELQDLITSLSKTR